MNPMKPSPAITEPNRNNNGLLLILHTRILKLSPQKLEEKIKKGLLIFVKKIIT